MVRFATSVLLLLAAAGVAKGDGHAMLAILRKNYTGNSNCTAEKATFFVGFSGDCLPHQADAGVLYTGKWRKVTCLTAGASTAEEVTYADAACTIPASNVPTRVLGMEGTCSTAVAEDSQNFCISVETFSLDVYPNTACSGNETTTEKEVLGQCFAFDSVFEKKDAVAGTTHNYKQMFYSDKDCTMATTSPQGVSEITFGVDCLTRGSVSVKATGAEAPAVTDSTDFAVRATGFFATLLLAVTVKLSL